MSSKVVHYAVVCVGKVFRCTAPLLKSSWLLPVLSWLEGGKPSDSTAKGNGGLAQQDL